jgi:hypothetical protein
MNYNNYVRVIFFYCSTINMTFVYCPHKIKILILYELKILGSTLRRTT